MQVMEVQLPGGLAQNGSIERSARFLALTGRIELSLIEARSASTRLQYVTRALCLALDSFGELPADAASVASLCVADRQFLMLRLAALLDGEQMWLKFSCSDCEAIFDIEVRRCELPVKPAGDDFPVLKLRLGGNDVQVRIPNGEDQQQIEYLDEDEAMHRLLRRCICTVNGEPPRQDFIESLSAADVELLDAALDEVSPAVCDRLQVTCPECGLEQFAGLDHYAPIAQDEYFFYDEIHTLASHYHWSESEILGLSQARRRRYLDLISRSGGRGRG